VVAVVSTADSETVTEALTLMVPEAVIAKARDVEPHRGQGRR
jgi:RNA binding exosome subunit